MRQKRLGQMKNDFIGNMTHELKTPISTIALSSEVLGDPGIVNEPERLKEYARIIRNENERLRIQVERVLQLSTLDKESLELKREMVDVHAITRSVAEHFQLPLLERRTELKLDLQAPNAMVYGDRVHLTNALTNLVDNALKYGVEGGRIELRTRNQNGDLSIAVEDDGIGIKKEDIKYIFERFYRVHTGNVHDVKGFGLGLHYVQHIAKAHGGRISAISEFGSGSTFTLLLPLARTA